MNALTCGDIILNVLFLGEKTRKFNGSAIVIDELIMMIWLIF